MQRLVITANGNYSFQIPTGRDFSFAASGADFDSAVLTPQYNTGMTPTAATGTLTGTTIAADDTVIIDSLTYTFVTALTDPAVLYEVLVGATDSDSLDNLIAAINGASGGGATYGDETPANPLVTAAAGAGDTLVVTSIEQSAAANDIATTAVLTAGDWGATTLTGGTDPIDRWKPFATTSLALSAAGEKFGTNVGYHNEINLNVASKAGTTKEIVVVIGPRAVQERGF